jgi:hypothetical protein
MRVIIAAILLVVNPMLFTLFMKYAFAETNRNATLSLLCSTAADSSYGKDSVYGLLDWCSHHPTAKTTRNVLRHLRRVIDARPVYMTIAAAINPDVSSREFHRATTRLVEELHEDAHSDVDSADRIEIFTLLL